MKIILKQTLLFSFFILIITGSYSSFTSLLNYIHKSHGQQHLWHAQIFFLVNSASNIVFNILIPKIKYSRIKPIGYLIPISFLINFLLTYIGFLTQNSNAILISTILGGLLAGIGGSAIWIFSGKYIGVLCQTYKAKEESGKYYGIFGGVMACNFFIGAIISATTWSFFSQKHNVYALQCILAFMSLFYYKFLVKDPENSDNSLIKLQIIETPKEIPKHELDNNSLISNQQKSKKFISLNLKCNKKQFYEVVEVYKKMISMMPFQFLNGLTVGYIYHCSEDLVFAPDQNAKDTFLTVTLMFVGIGSTIGAYAAGHLSDRLSSKKVFYLGVCVCLISFCLGMIALHKKSQLAALITSLISGFGMMYTNNMLVVMCSKYYDGSMMVFGANRQMINIAFLIYNLVINVISAENMHSQMFYELSIFITISLICIYLVQYIRVKKYSNLIEEDMNEIRAEEMSKVTEEMSKVIDSTPYKNS